MICTLRMRQLFLFLVLFISLGDMLTYSNALLLTMNAINCKSLYSKTFIGPSPLWYLPPMIEHSGYIIRSYYQVSGKELVDLSILEKDPFEAAKQLFFKEKLVVLSHGIQTEPNGPILNYGNSAALKRWGASWEDLTTMPSKYTAEPQAREIRERFMKDVLEKGLVTDYRGVRIALDKTRFEMIDASVWNIVVDNVRIGQAACFDNWVDL